MRLAKVVGQVVATVKEPGLDSFKILLVEDLDATDPERETFDGEAYPAIDVVGAGEGEVVLVASGSAARIHHGGVGRCPSGCVIVGGEVTFKK